MSASTVLAHVLVSCFEVIAPQLYPLVCSVKVRIRNIAGQDILADNILVNVTTDQIKA